MSDALLVELLTEELPPKSLATLGYAFADALVTDLRERGFAAPDCGFDVFATPRRLGVLVRAVAARAPDREVVTRGPSLKAGLDAEGRPTAALTGFARKVGAEVGSLAREHDGKQEVFVHRSVAKGAALAAALAPMVEAALARLPVPKMMRWGDSDAEFVRPVRGLVMLHGANVVEGTVLGAASGRTTRGHRFMGSGAVTIPRAEDYEHLIEREGKVIANFERRERLVREGLASAAGAASVAADDALVAEVTALVEHPSVYEGHFEKHFLEVPQECLMLTMRQNQKYFPLVDGSGRLLNRFLVVSNIATPHPARIVHGNERVLRARLADARFFYDQDRRRPLASLVERLGAVVYHNRLGTQLERVARLEALAGAIARELGADEALARRAARLAKADLVTGMVGEFPELQGIMGMHYARHDGEPEAVAAAIEAHYRPRFAGDALPESPIGAAVALADKLDTLVGIWGIGLAPTGDKDPFALRRAALGVVRILAELELPLDLVALLAAARAGFGATPLEPDTVPAVHQFALERLRGVLRERGYAPDEIDAVLAQNPTRIDLVPKRLAAVAEFRRLPEAASLAAANKLIRNILRKAALPPGREPQAALAREPAEKALLESLAHLAPDTHDLVERGEYTRALVALARAREPVDRFFDEVLVMAEDEAVRANRLALLARLDGLMNAVADISKLAA
ncbi:MAG: glycine--tRNA ligase subunit beta [Burkholderiales bacterium]|nr:glycine--tRNA ligase subunit beta [Burkholderiales bacterium]